MSEAVTEVLGVEQDRRLRRSVVTALRRAGGRRSSGWWGVGGSQEIERTEWRVHGRTLVLEAETYVGLTLSGPADLVARVLSLVR